MYTIQLWRLCSVSNNELLLFNMWPIYFWNNLFLHNLHEIDRRCRWRMGRYGMEKCALDMNGSIEKNRFAILFMWNLDFLTIVWWKATILNFNTRRSFTSIPVTRVLVNLYYCHMMQRQTLSSLLRRLDNVVTHNIPFPQPHILFTI